MDYEKDVRIDEDALDVEWLGQAELSMKYGQIWARAAKEVARTEEDIKVIRAELVSEAHADSDNVLGKGVKPTGPVVEAYYRNHPRHKDAKEAWIEAVYECNMADIAKKEISYTRKAALEYLVKLHGQSYFAGPSMPRDLSSEVEQKNQQRKVDAKVAAGMQRKKK